MPVTSRFMGGKYRVVESSTGRVAKRRDGAAVDGGGHTTRKEADDQARAINASKA